MRKTITILIGPLFAIGTLGLVANPSHAQTVFTVELDGVQFIPADVSISVGDTIRWVWVTGFHNVESGVIVDDGGVPDGNFRSGDPTIGAGITFELVFDESFLTSKPIAGNAYPYYCIIHTAFQMAGVITVLIPGDVDGDADVDLDDHATLVECTTGPDGSSPVGDCLASEFDLADMDGDGDVDLRDAAALQRAFTG